MTRVGYLSQRLGQAITTTVAEGGMPEGVRFDCEAVALLGHSLETMLSCYFDRGVLRAKHRKRKSVAPQDLSLGEVLRDDAAVEKSLLETQQAQEQRP